MVEDGQEFVVAAAYAGADRDPAWWINLRVDPSAVIELGRRRLDVRAEGGR